VISGNLIGTNASGMAALSTAAYGVCLDNGAGYNTVGGKTVGERNVISGNWLGVWLSGADTSFNKVYGNYIGLSASGTAAVPNAYVGIYVISGADHTTIGGTGAGERNVISGNAYDGVSIYGSDTDSNTVAGNYIGTDANGTLPLGNGYEGVKIYGDCDNNVVGAGNVIAYNARNGVLVDQSNQSSALGNRITQNSIHDNGLAGIDLANSANGSIAVPVLMAVSYGATIDISGTACGGCTVEVLGSTANDGEGEVYLGSALAEAGGAFVLSLDTLGQPYLTATATDAIKGTSEFSAPYEAPALRLRIYLPLVVRKQALSW